MQFMRIHKMGQRYNKLKINSIVEIYFQKFLGGVTHGFLWIQIQLIIVIFISKEVS